MSKFVPIIIGGLEIAAGILIDIGTLGGGAVLGNMLIAAGVGQVIGGIGTLLNQPQAGLTTASRNPIQPWNICYGRCKVGGTIVFINEHGESDKYLDLVFVLAAHQCESVDALLFDNQRLLIGPNGNSVRPETDSDGDQQAINISSIVRSNGVVTVTLSSAFTNTLQDGDQIIIKGVTGQVTNDKSLNGRYYISVTNTLVFTYLCGGFDVSLSGTGQAQTAFPNYREKVHMEVLLGNHTETFPGMISGTPYDDSSDLVTVADNPWTAQHLLLGKTAVFLRLHYNDEVFAAGLPQISFRLHGKNDIADPRSGTGYTENSALCIADLLTNQTWGFKASSDEVPSDQLITAANICDEAVTLANGSTEPRYALNGQFTLAMKRGEILQNMLTSCGGRITYQGGQFVIHPAAWPGVSLSVGRVITSATLNVVTTHIPGTGYVANGEATAGDPNSIFSTADFMIDSSAWTERTNSVTLTEVPGSLTVSFAIAGALSGDASPPDQLLVYQCWMDATFADGSTATMVPTTAKGFDASTGTVTDAANAIDGDPATYATISRSHFSSLSSSPVLELSGFSLQDSSPISPIGAEQIAGSLEGLSLMAGPFRWKSKLSIRDLYNGVKGTYVSPVNGWQISDYPPYAQDSKHGYGGDVSPALPEGDANMAADGGDRRWFDLQLPFTISPSCAQRLAKIQLMRLRQQGNGTFAFNMSLYWATALDVVSMTLPLLGWQGKLLEIQSHRLTPSKQQGPDGNDVTLLGCEIDVQETDPTVYDWTATEELTPQGFQQSVLPDTSRPKPPTNITLESDASTSIVGSDGIARSRILVTWTAPADGYVLQGGHIEIQYRNTSSPADAWISLGNIDPTVTSAYIDGVIDGQTYDVQIRSVNAAGVPSDWVDAGNITVSGQSSQISPGIITQDGATNGQGLVWNGTEWVPTTLAQAIELQTNSVDNTLQTKLNLIAGTNIGLSADGSGGVTITASAGGSGIVPATRAINTTAPLTGGGDLSADRTLAISNFTGDSGSGGAKGAVPAPASGDAAAGKFLKADGSWAVPSGGGGSNPYDVLCAVVGKPGAGATVLIVTFDRSVTFAGNFSGSAGTVGTNPASSATFAVNKNGSSIGSVAISTSGVFTFTTTSGASQSFSSGDRLTVTAPGTQDSTLADIAITFGGTR